LGRGASTGVGEAQFARWQGLTENMLFWYGAKRQIDPVDYY
jgi:hypothetical protein